EQQETTTVTTRDNLQSLSASSPVDSGRELTRSSKQSNAKSGNCNVVQFLENVLPSNENKGDYYAISCKNKGINKAEDENFLDNWKGLFPKKLFKRNNKLNKNQKFEIKIESDMEEATEGRGSQVILLSPEFKKTEILGKWNYKSLGDNYGILIKLITKQTGEIYLILPVETRMETVQDFS
ncbi:hypothetical protein DNK47_03290, partial [Mycoplasma wenyonii]